MKANELMIGDWVSYNGQPLRVNCVAIGSIGLEGVDSDIICKEEMVKPIPLTPEILEKDGFEKDPETGEMIWYDDDVTEVVWLGTLLRIRCEYGICDFAAIIYVNELQHALRLCGIEKTIEL